MGSEWQKLCWDDFWIELELNFNLLGSSEPKFEVKPSLVNIYWFIDKFIWLINSSSTIKKCARIDLKYLYMFMLFKN